MTPDTLPSVLTDALPGVTVAVRVPEPGVALVLEGENAGEYVIIHNYVQPGEPKPLPCTKHGAQRHDFIGGKYVCKKCRETST